MANTDAYAIELVVSVLTVCSMICFVKLERSVKAEIFKERTMNVKRILYPRWSFSYKSIPFISSKWPFINES